MTKEIQKSFFDDTAVIVQAEITQGMLEAHINQSISPEKLTLILDEIADQDLLGNIRAQFQCEVMDLIYRQYFKEKLKES